MPSWKKRRTKIARGVEGEVEGGELGLRRLFFGGRRWSFEVEEVDEEAV